MARNARIGLIFHGIGAPGRTLEPGEAPYWISTDLFEAVLDRIAGLPQPESFQLTFDDGNASDHDIALPRLVQHGLQADFFVLAGRMGQIGSLTEAQVRALLAAGMQVGSHGMDHRNLTRLDTVALDRELAGSRQALEKICQKSVTSLGIPFGAYDRRVLNAARAAGYQTAYSSDKGRMGDGFLRPRMSIRGAMTGAEIDAMLTAHLGPKARLRRALGMARRRWF